ncbi:MAG: LptF/LptG family permease, partial [Xanthomonadales bacterium]|nr:LptF/LptG family permease [Xanthomonadales bacterium]
MSVLQRYLYREWLLTFLAVSIVLTVVLLGVFLGELLNDVANGSIPAGLIGTQLLLRFPEAMGEMLPLAAFIAVMWGLGRLYRDQEMAVMRASGFTWPMM